MNGVLTDGRIWRFVRIERDTLYHFDVALDSKLTELPHLLHYLKCFAMGEHVPCKEAEWPPYSKPNAAAPPVLLPVPSSISTVWFT